MYPMSPPHDPIEYGEASESKPAQATFDNHNDRIANLQSEIRRKENRASQLLEQLSGSSGQEAEAELDAQVPPFLHSHQAPFPSMQVKMTLTLKSNHNLATEAAKEIEEAEELRQKLEAELKVVREEQERERQERERKAALLKLPRPGETAQVPSKKGIGHQDELHQGPPQFRARCHFETRTGSCGRRSCRFLHKAQEKPFRKMLKSLPVRPSRGSSTSRKKWLKRDKGDHWRQGGRKK